MEKLEQQNPCLRPSSPEGASVEDSLEELKNEEQTHSLYMLSLKEFAPLSAILSTIPAQAQRGLSKFDIEFTCIDAHPDWIAVGSNVGTLFLYERRTGELTRLRYQDYIGNVTCVRFYSVGEMMVAFGTHGGVILVYQVPDNMGANKQLECFTISGYHNAPITCLDWSQNGMLLFSGDVSGLVVSTTIEYFEHCSRSRVLVQEPQGIVQLSYHPASLLIVSTLQRCFLCHLQNEEPARTIQIGQKERKLQGKFGGIFDPISLSTNSLIVCTARPGLRLWKADLEGTVIETLLLKDSCLTARKQASVQVVNMDFIKDVSVPSEGEQFGPLRVFQGLFILTWNSIALYVLDPEMRGVVASTGLGDLTNINDVATCADEIFVLQGKRNIRRLATSPEEEVNLNPFSKKESEASQLLSSILSPFQGLVKERSTSNVLEWFRLKPDTNKNVKEEPTAVNNLLPPLVALSKDALEVGLELQDIPKLADKSDKEPSNLLELDNRVIIQNFIAEQKSEPFDQKLADDSDQEMTDSPVVVYKVKKGRKKRAKAKMTMRKMVEINSVYSENSSAEIPETPPRPQIFSPSFTSPEENHNEDDLLAKILGSYLSNNNNENSNQDEEPSKETRNEPLKEDPILFNRESSTPSEENNIELEADSKVTNSIELDCVIPQVQIQSGISKTAEPLSPDVDIYTSHPTHKPLRRTTNVIKQSAQSIPEKLPEEATPEEPLGEEWVQYKGPSEHIISLSVSSCSLYVVDNNEVLYYSNLKGPGLEWFRVSQSAHQVSVSPSGSFLWVLHKKSAFAVALSSLSGAPRGKFTEAAMDVSKIAVDNDCAWYLKLDGELRLQKGLSAARPCFKALNMSCPVGTVSQLSCRKGVLWILTQQSKLYCCSLPSGSENSSTSVQNVSWREIQIREPMCLDTISLGTNCTGWFVSDEGKLWMKEGISADRPQGDEACWQVSMEMVRTKEKDWKPFFSETSQFLLTAGPKGLWVSLDSLLWASRGNLIGNKWDKISRNLNWNYISTSGSNQGPLWMLTKAGELQCLHSLHTQPTNLSLTPEDSRASGGLVCLSPSPSSLWVLRDSGSILTRVGISPPAHFQGTGWTTIDLSQLGECKLVHLSCGENAVWACDDLGCVWTRIGPLLCKQSLEPAWIQPDDDRTSKYSKVYVSGNGQLVWAIDSSYTVYAREGVSLGYPIGRRWNVVPGMQASALALSNHAVYALSTSGTVHRRTSIDHAQYPAGIRWKHLEGIQQCLSISVTAGDELWALDKTGWLLQHVSTKVKHQTEGSVHQHPVLVHFDSLDGPDEGWEVI